MTPPNDFDQYVLSTGVPITPDFTIAQGPLSIDQLSEIRDILAERDDERSKVSRADLNECLPVDFALSGQQAISLFIGLRQAGVATEKEAGKSYADYQFELENQASVDFLDQQLTAKLALDTVTSEKPERTGIRLVVSLPDHIQPAVLEDSNVTRLGPRLRSMLFDAEETIRIANPYFDTSDSVISDLASLPQRGVDTRILTRQVNTNRVTRMALQRVTEALDNYTRSNLSVRDLYRRDEESGEHVYAVHAKVVISDEQRCYIGSANLMQSGLTSNFELGVLLEGRVVNQVIAIFDAAFEASDLVEL